MLVHSLTRFAASAAGAFWGMSARNHYSVRVIVQHVYGDRRSRYRLVVYGDAWTCRPLEFDSVDSLQKTFHSFAPDFDVSRLSIKEDARESYIAFAGEMELDDSQLSILGLKDGSKP